MALFKMATQAYLIFKEGGLLLRNLDKTKLQNTPNTAGAIRRRGRGLQGYSQSGKKYFDSSVEEDEEPTVNSTE